MKTLLRNSSSKLNVMKRVLTVALSFVFVQVVSVMINLDAAGTMFESNGTYYTDFNSFDEVEQAAFLLNEQVGEEGIILMKNNGTLPFEDVSTITVLGKNSVDLAYGGGGSGSGDSSASVTLQESLEAAGYLLNPKTIEFYNNDALSGTGKTAASLGAGLTVIGETPMSYYGQDVLDSFGYYNDAAVIVISRTGSEGADNPVMNPTFRTEKSV